MIPTEKEVEIESFTKEEVDQAKELLAKLEEEDEGAPSQSVMVSVDSIAELELAYPNYFADTVMFSRVLSSFLNE